jgi:hypothetical protein
MYCTFETRFGGFALRTVYMSKGIKESADWSCSAFLRKPGKVNYNLKCFIQYFTYRI